MQIDALAGYGQGWSAAVPGTSIKYLTAAAAVVPRARGGRFPLVVRTALWSYVGQRRVNKDRLDAMTDDQTYDLK